MDAGNFARNFARNGEILPRHRGGEFFGGPGVEFCGHRGENHHSMGPVDA
jgi:hypothetical protein